MFFGKCYPSCVRLFGVYFEGREAIEGCGSLGHGCGCGCGPNFVEFMENYNLGSLGVNFDEDFSISCRLHGQKMRSSWIMLAPRCRLGARDG